MSSKKSTTNKNFPEVTNIHFSRGMLVFYVILYSILVCGLIAYFISAGFEGFSFTFFCLLFFLIGGSYMLQDYVRKLFSKKPHITLSRKGIETATHQRYPWSKIKNLAINKRMSNKSYEFFLEYGTTRSVC